MDPVVATLPIELQVESRRNHRATARHIDLDALAENMVYPRRSEVGLLVVRIVAELDIGIDQLLQVIGNHAHLIASTPPVTVLDGVVAGNIAEIEVSPNRIHIRQGLLVLVVTGPNLVPALLLDLAEEVGADLVPIERIIAVGVRRYRYDTAVGLLDIDVPIIDPGLTRIPLAVGVAVFVLEATQPWRATPGELQPDIVNRGVILDRDLEIRADPGDDIDQAAVRRQI